MIGADSLVDFDSCQTNWVWPFPAPQNFTVHSVYSGENINRKQVRDLTKTIWYYILHSLQTYLISSSA